MSSIAVNLHTHGRAIAQAYEDVVRGAPGVEWAVFGYDKGTHDLKVTETGVGLEDLSEEFSDGKMQYAFARVVDPNSALPKLILISWCGSGVPEGKKGLFASHLTDVAKYLKGYHLQINARQDSDVEPAYIMKRLEESGGSKYSIHREPAQRMTRPALVGSTYQPVRIAEEMSNYRSQSATVTGAVAGASATSRVSNRPALGGVNFEKQAQDDGRNERERQESLRIEQERKQDRERMERQRAEDIERQRQAAQEARLQAEAEEKTLIAAAAERKALEAQAAADARRKLEERDQHIAEAAAKAKITSIESVSSDVLAVALYDYTAEEPGEISICEGEVIRVTVSADDDWWTGINSKGETGIFPATYVEAQAAATPTGPAPIPAAAPKADEVAPSTASASASVSDSTAVALYDYEATEEDEIPLTEGELISDLLAESDDWWRGTKSDGRRGLFPATYVEHK